MSLRLDGCRAVLERIEANLVVVEEDPLVAEELDDIFIWCAACYRTTFALDKLDVKLARLVCVEIPVNTKVLFVQAEELFLIQRHEIHCLGVRSEELCFFPLVILVLFTV